MNIRPEIKQVRSVALPVPAKVDVPQFESCFSFDLSEQEMIKIEVVFPCGIKNEDKALSADYAAKLMKNGARNRSSNDILETIDNNGAFLEHSISKDHLTMTLYTLVRNLNAVLSTFQDVLECPNYLKEEFELAISNDLQSFKVNKNKVAEVCRREFGYKLYNPTSSYARLLNEKDFESLSVDDVREFAKENIALNEATVLVSGAVSEVTIRAIKEVFSKTLKIKSKKIDLDFISSSQLGNHFFHQEGAMQSAIRVGKLLNLKRMDVDYVPFQVLSTVLGGYFSSRLMMNIREDKGYTYGIGSGVIANLHSTTFLIATEVRANSTKDTLIEIYKEIENLQNEILSNEELVRVKSYLIGSFLRGSDGVFQVADRFKSTYLFGIDYDYYNTYIDMLNRVTAKDVQDMAVKYLDKNSMLEVVAGAYE